MEKTTSLGRERENVSRFPLSERPREAADHWPEPVAATEGRRVVRVLHPCSPLDKALFMANFSLELARSRRPAVIWDGDGGEGSRVADMMEGIVRPDLVPGALAVRLYGLPDVLIHGPATHPGEKPGEPARAVAPPEGEGFLLLSLPDTVESIVQGDVPFDAVVLCPPDEASLLKAYAFVKVIREKDPASRVYLVFDGQPPGEKPRETASRFEGFLREKLPGWLACLGSLHRDETLERSMEERLPVVLGHGVSAYRDSLQAVSAAFLASVKGAP